MKLAAFRARVGRGGDRAAEVYGIRILRKQGLGLRAIACQTGVSVNTVRKYLADELGPRYKPRELRAGKLEPFKAYLIERFDATHSSACP